MKTLFTSCLIGCTFLLFSCNPAPTREENTGRKGEPLTDSPEYNNGQLAEESAAPRDSLLMVLGGPTAGARVTAGESVGILRLKTPSDTLFALLGKPDSAAADMCKDLSAWQPGKARLRVYSLCDNDFDMRKSMQIIGLSGGAFSTASGLSEKSTLAEIRQAYPNLQIAGKFTSAGGSLFIADEVEKGIAFELSDTSADAKVSGVLVHLPGKPVTATTIPLYPNLEQ